MRRRTLAAVALLGLARCGDRDPAPPAPTGTDKPVLRAAWHGRPLETWLALASNEAAAQRVDAAWALAEVGVGSPAAADALRRLATDPEADVRFAAYVAASRLRLALTEASAEAVVRDLRADGAALRQAAREVLAGMGEAAVRPLALGLASADARERWAALRGLQALGRATPEVVADVRRLGREDADPAVRRAALMAAPHLGAEGVAFAVEELRSEDFRRHQVAGAALAEARGKSVAALLPLLEDPDEVVAARAAGVLADVGSAAAPAVPALVEAMRRGGPARFNALEALIAIGAPAVAALEAVAAGSDVTLAALASDALARIRERR